MRTKKKGGEGRMKYWQRFKIAVFGSAGGEEVKRLEEIAWIIGKQIALNEGILITGGCPGIPYAAARGADNYDGLVIGFSPGGNLTEHTQRYKFPWGPHVLALTNFGKKGRNVVSTNTADAGIYICGRTGSTNEFTDLFDEADNYKVIALLQGSGGDVDAYMIPRCDKKEKPTKAIVIIERDPVKLVQQVFEELKKLRQMWSEIYMKGGEN